MVWLKIENVSNNDTNPDMDINSLIKQLNDELTSKDKHVFILYFMEGCGPCNATRPEWYKIENVLPANGLDRDDIVIASIDQRLSGKLKVGTPPNSFPTMRYITDRGNVIENYEDATFSHDKDRTVDSFVEWIQSKASRKTGAGKTRKHRKLGKVSKVNRMRGGKWSRKYKLSINCKRPKGFSQRQYCKYGRNKK
jgi:thiol-disulfide isomerase/thioredoxin